MQLEQSLTQAKCTFPFTELGANFVSDPGLFSVTAWLPDAHKVSLIDLGSGQTLGELTNDTNSGLFKGQFSLKIAPKAYAFSVTNSAGEYRVIDPYQFQEQAYQGVHFIEHQAQNVYQQLGAQLMTLELGLEQPMQVTRFAVYAPNASAVSLIGDFNFWDPCCLPMQKTDNGYWVLVVPGVEAGATYKYHIKDASGVSLPHKADPVGFYAQQYPSHTSVVYDQDQYQWQDKAWLKQAKKNKYQQPMSIYEVHLASWMRPGNSPQDGYLSYRDLVKQLIPYIKDMSYTHIELLPISEFPFDGSWGYQPVGLFAPTSRFGSPDDFKFFVDQCHQNGIGVIIDWVPAHFPEDGHGLARFDGTHLYEYADPRKGWHPDWNSCIYDFGKDSVRQFLVANALFWMDKYHIDGLRVDAVASMLYLDYSRKEGEWIPNVDGGNHNYEAISLLQWMNTELYEKFPNAMTIAEESTSFAKVSRPVFEGGLGFGFKWNMGWMHDSLHYIAKDPSYRPYHHNEITFSMVYAFDESFVLPISHDEVVHGKGSLLRKMPGDEWQQAANLRVYAAFMYAHPGKKLNFMGNEIGQAAEWNHDSSVNWHLLDYAKHQGIQALYKDLNKAYIQYPALYELDHSAEGFEWIDQGNSQQSVLSVLRKSIGQKQKVYVLMNFTSRTYDNFKLGVQDPGEYALILNTDDKKYWGSDYPAHQDPTAITEPWQGQPGFIEVNLPPLGALFILHKG